MERNRIIRPAFILVVISFVLSTAVSLWSLGNMARHNSEELSRVLAARIYDTISSELSEPVIVSQTMTHDSFLISVLENEPAYDEAEIAGIMQNYLSTIRNGLDYEAAFVISQASGRYYSYRGILKTIHPDTIDRDAWYTAFVESQKAYSLDVDNDEVSSNAWTVFVNARIENEKGKLLGVCGVGWHMKRSLDLFESLENEYGVRINLVNPEGLISVDTDVSRIERDFLENFDLIQKQPDEDYVYQRLNDNRFIVTRYIDRLDWYLVVQSNDGGSISQFWNIILLNLALCAVVLLLLILTIRITVVRTRALTHASFRDHTTTLLNRRAFEEAKEKYMKRALPGNFVYVTADVNGLKTVNDTLGHAAGDELIRGAAQCLKACFGKYGKIYRIGGDEFAALLTVPEGRLRDIMTALETTVSAWSGETVKTLSLSCGYAEAREFPAESISELGRISDERMYLVKNAYYEKTGASRRT